LKVIAPSLVLTLSALTACQTIPNPLDSEPLSNVAAKPLQYRGETIKVCGFATKQFENVQITTSRKWAWGDNSVGLGVDWLDEEPRTKRPDYQWSIRQTELGRD